jgi:hypothetical protein
VRPLRLAAGIVLVSGLLAGGVGRAAEEALPELVAPYLEAKEQKALGTVAASAFADPPRPSGSPVPQASVSVMVLPASAGFQSELDAAKAGLRESIDAYVQTVSRIETARTDYERALLDAGAGELVRSGQTDAQGALRLEDLPAGDWIVLAWREGGHLTKKFRLRETESSKFPHVPSSVTYSVVTFWRMRVAVRPGEATEVALTDRNVWLSAGRQEGGTPVPPRGPSGRGNKRR